MSDTPKTDWAETNEQGERTGYVRASFCRQLERELAEAHERIAYLEAITTGAEHKAVNAAMKEKK